MTITAKRYTPDGALTLSEAKRRLRPRHTQEVRRLINAGHLQAFRLGCTWVVESSVQTYAQQYGILPEEGCTERREAMGEQHSSRHVWCRPCGYRLLQSIGGKGRGAGATHWYVYRDGKAGMGSPEIIFCPHCAAALSMENIREGDDGQEQSLPTL